MSALLEVRDLGVSAAHGGPAVVRGVSYTVNRNEILCVVGNRDRASRSPRRPSWACCRRISCA